MLLNARKNLYFLSVASLPVCKDPGYLVEAHPALKLECSYLYLPFITGSLNIIVKINPVVYYPELFKFLTELFR